MRLSQTKILEHAERLSSALAGGATLVERNVLLAVVGDFMADRSPEPRRLRETLRLVRAGSGGHLKRGGGYAEQLKAATRELESFLEAEGTELEPNDLKSVFGWTARLLLVRGASAPSPPQAGARQTRSGKAIESRAAPVKAPQPKSFGGLNARGLSTLEKLRAQLEGRDQEKKP